MSVGLYLLAEFDHSQGDPDAVLTRLQSWVEHYCADLVPTSSIGTRDTSPTLFCNLHPTAEDVEISFVDSTHLTVSAKTSTTGPGYHIVVGRMLRAMAAAFGLQWIDTSADEETEYLDETGYFFTGDEELVYDEMLAWLKGLCGSFFDGTFGNGTTMLCLPMDDSYPNEPDRAVTPLGPRNLGWLEKTAKDPLRGRDFFAWWNPEPDAEYFRSRALARMWREVRWRKPSTDAERDVLKYCLNSLEIAHKLDAALEYPWAEWAEMLEYSESNDEISGEVRSRATALPTIGYRRRNVAVGLPGHWRIQIPGSFTDLQYDDDGTTSAFDPPRELWFDSYSFTESTPEAFERRRAEILTQNSELVHEAERYIAAANIKKRDNGESEWFVLSSSNVCVVGRSVCTIVFIDPNDREWAINTWKSLQPPWTNKEGAD